MTVTAIVDESATIKSFHLQPGDGAGLLPHRAGQHLPIRIKLPSKKSRSFAPTRFLSRPPMGSTASASSAMVRFLSFSMIVLPSAMSSRRARQPATSALTPARHVQRFFLQQVSASRRCSRCSVMSFTKGSASSVSVRSPCSTRLAPRAIDRFDKEIADLIGATKGAVRMVKVLSDTTDAEEGSVYDAAGRIDMAMLTRFLPFNDYDFYLCGPAQFTQGLYDGLRSFNIA